jgi:integrase
MAIERLRPEQVRKLASGKGAAGRYGDGGGLFALVKKDGRATWILRYQRGGVRRDMGLGRLYDVPLSSARELARECRRKLAFGLDPLAERDAERRRAALTRATNVTFENAAEQFLKHREAAGEATKTNKLWRATLRQHAYPVLGNLRVAEIDRSHVLKVIEPLWHTKPETASRVRQRIEAVLDAAAARGQRSTENPARWAALKPVLGVRRKAVVHHAALRWQAVPDFMKALAEQDGLGARALEFTILTAVRTNETLGATWAEISGDVWEIPGARMKAKRPHRVPLSSQACALLDRLHNIRRPPFVFFGAKDGKSLSNMAMLTVLRRMKRTDITPHGFRSAFRDWCSDNGHDRELAEQALAHTRQGVEAAYARSDIFQRRVALMQAWADFCRG